MSRALHFWKYDFHAIKMLWSVLCNCLLITTYLDGCYYSCYFLCFPVIMKRCILALKLYTSRRQSVNITDLIKNILTHEWWGKYAQIVVRWRRKSSHITQILSKYICLHGRLSQAYNHEQAFGFSLKIYWAKSSWKYSIWCR